MRKSIIISVLIFPFIAVGCAKRPNAVVPVSLPAQTYANYSCEELAVELPRAIEERDALVKKQRDAANADAVGVFLVAVPVGGLLGGDVEGELAIAKGKVLAIQSSQTAQKCAENPILNNNATIAPSQTTPQASS